MVFFKDFSYSCRRAILHYSLLQNNKFCRTPLESCFCVVRIWGYFRKTSGIIEKVPCSQSTAVLSTSFTVDVTVKFLKMSKTILPEAATGGVLWEKVFLEILQNSQENTCARVSFLINACNFFKKETLTQVFSCEFCEISKNTFSHRTPPVAASAILQQKLCIKISSDKCICCFYWLFKTLAVNLCCILNNSQQK